MASNIFNDESKKEATKQELADYFKVDERPAMVRIKEWLGMSGEPEAEKGVVPASYSPWSSVKGRE